MKPEKLLRLTAIVVIISIAISASAIIAYFRIKNDSKQFTSQYQRDLASLQKTYTELEEKVRIVVHENERIKRQLDKLSFPDQALQLPVQGSKNVPANSIDQQNNVEELKEIISSTGLDQLAASGEFDSDTLQKMVSDFVAQDNIREYREKMIARNQDLYQKDEEQYNEELMALYKQARLRGPGRSQREEREKAFKELLETYPDAYITGMAIAERALRSGIRRDTESVETYYGMLMENDNFADIVTDRGTEALPNIQHYLANSYLQQGQISEAQDMIELLSSSYPHSYVYARGPDFRWQLQPVWQVVDNLRQEIE